GARSRRTTRAHPAPATRSGPARRLSAALSRGGHVLVCRPELVELFAVRDCNSKAARLDMAKLGWVNQHFLKTTDPVAIAPHLVYQLEKLGLDLDKGPKPEEVVVALRERVQTLKEMAEKSVVRYTPPETYDEAAVAKH